MTTLEIVLLFLVLIWLVIFIIIAVFLILLLLSVKKGLDRINKLLDKTENMAEGVGIPLKIFAEKISNFFSKKSKRK